LKINFLGLPTPIWVDPNIPPDGRDAEAKQAANNVLVVILFHFTQLPKIPETVRR
jgi:hypothetical protein